VCCYPCVLPQYVAPALNALYNPEQHSEFFLSSDSVCDWLSAVFSAASGENVPFSSYFSCNEFVVCNLAHRSTISLHGLDISASFFHPWSMLETFVPLSSAHNHPVWFYYQKKHYLASLIQLPRTELVSSLKLLGIPCRNLTKSAMSSQIFQQFLINRTNCMSRSTDDLISEMSLAETVATSSHSSVFYYLFFKKQFGNAVMSALLVPENIYYCSSSISTQILYDFELEQQLLSLTDSSSNSLPSSLFSKSTLKSVLSCVHQSRRPSFQYSHANYVSAIVQSFRERCKNLLHCNISQIADYIMCFEPFFKVPAVLSFKNALIYLLNLEYSPAIVTVLTKSVKIHQEDKSKSKRVQQLHDRVVSNAHKNDNIINNWPTLPDDEVIYDCLRAYRSATNVSTFQTCACCSRVNHAGIENISLQNFDDIYDELNLHLLQCKNPLLIVSFTSLPEPLKHLMLHPSGITNESNEFHKSILHLCKDCCTQLQKNKMPRFALANNLF
jgi:hypothetical protein